MALGALLGPPSPRRSDAPRGLFGQKYGVWPNTPWERAEGVQNHPGRVLQDPPRGVLGLPARSQGGGFGRTPYFGQEAPWERRKEAFRPSRAGTQLKVWDGPRGPPRPPSQRRRALLRTPF